MGVLNVPYIQNNQFEIMSPEVSLVRSETNFTAMPSRSPLFLAKIRALKVSKVSG